MTANDDGLGRSPKKGNAERVENVAVWLCPAKMSPQRGDATDGTTSNPFVNALAFDFKLK